jgi:hypothetical protein
MCDCHNGDAVVNDPIDDAVWKSMRPQREITSQLAADRRIAADATNRVGYFGAERIAESGEAIFVITPGGSQLLAGFWQKNKV